MITNSVATTLQRFAAGATCEDSTFFGIGTWHKYVPETVIRSQNGDLYCSLDFSQFGIGTFFLVIAGFLDILLKIGAIVAVAYFIYGAFRMVTSQGSPEGVKAARGTMTNALIGLAICVLSSWLIGFLIERILG